MIVPADLLAGLKRLLKRLEPDIRSRCEASSVIDARLRTEHEKARSASRTAQAYEVWREDYITQVAVAWILGCVFVRFLEDNLLIDTAWLAGPNERLQLARDQHTLYFQANPTHSDREYLAHVFEKVAQLPSMRDLLDGSHNPLSKLGPTGDGAHELLEFWQKVNPSTGVIIHDFADPEWNTRFLGDLYQDLSETARERYALLQTPDFIEEFILDRTLMFAVQDFGLSVVKLIDPACGSGHFLLGGYRRIFDLWLKVAPGSNLIALAQKSLDSVAGVDLNPYATAIARFRLLVAALQSCQIKTLSQAPDFRLNIASGDSLLHGPRPGEVAFRQMYIDGREPLQHVYDTEDAEELRRILSRRYHVVVGNPPYISVNDRIVSAEYRRRFSACYKQFSLVIPFVQRFFDLAVCAEAGSTTTAGYIGLIIADSFKKAAFGKRLIEEHLPHLDVTDIIDTSRAYIPGHATPTVILFARNRQPTKSTVRAVIGVEGEPSVPQNPSKGLVWQEIIQASERADYTGRFVVTMDVERSSLAVHPWIFADAQSSHLLSQITSRSTRRLASIISSIGFFQDTHSDEAFVQPRCFVTRHQLEKVFRDHVRGDDIREWRIASDEAIFFPYDAELRQWDSIPHDARFAWFHALQCDLWNRKTFTGKTYKQEGRAWFDYHQFPKERAKAPMMIAFAALASHNHFVLDTANKVFSRSAPVIHLATVREEDHLALVGLLNSSLACFWIKQMMRDKGNGGIGGGIGSEAWERRYLIDGTKLEQFPLCSELLSDDARTMHHLAFLLEKSSPEYVLRNFQDLRGDLEEAKTRSRATLGKMIALQEEMDWSYYRAYGLVDENDPSFTYKCDLLPSVELGERAFEIVLAQAAGTEAPDLEWFRRHRTTPAHDVPARWREDYRSVVSRRMQLIKSNGNIALLERPEYKRRWNVVDWQIRTTRAIREWLLNWIESSEHWASVELSSCSKIADLAQRDERFREVAQVYKERLDVDWLTLVTELVESESVPFLGKLRFSASGLAKHKVWEACQRLQVASYLRAQAKPGNQGAQTVADQQSEEQTPITVVPPRYEKEDFLKSGYWNLRGKLDVPKERFIRFPFCERDVDQTPVIGWAGWNHLQKAQGIAAYYERVKNHEGWKPERRVPLLAGILELIPWLKQWHNEVHPEYKVRMGNFFQQFVEDEARVMEMTMDQIREWKPPVQSSSRGRKKGNT